MLQQKIRAKWPWGCAIRVMSVLVVAAFVLCVNAATTGPTSQDSQQDGLSAIVPWNAGLGRDAAAARALPVLSTPRTVAPVPRATVSPAKQANDLSDCDPPANVVLRRKRSRLLAGLIIMQLAHSHHGH